MLKVAISFINSYALRTRSFSSSVAGLTFSISLRKRTASSPYKTGVSPIGLAIIFSIWLIHCKNSKFIQYNKVILIFSFSFTIKQHIFLQVCLFVLHIFNVYCLGTVLCNHLLYLLLNVRYGLNAKNRGAAVAVNGLTTMRSYGTLNRYLYILLLFAIFAVNREHRVRPL